uniref:Acyltransferase n=1 Tax=Globisporangium ultimum (strain ATCC 200006 / CBS 805.95 / DAOM BR144) TaxID=431595 RepID=K3W7H8_GLOUD
MGDKKKQQQVWPASVTCAVAAYAICVALDASAKLTFTAVLLALYLPSYLDGSEYTGERYWPAFATFSQKYMAGIPMTLEYEEPVDPAKQYMFCSHPHGLLSAHHGILMQGCSTPSFHDLSPMITRRHLAASVVFRIPIYREYALWLGCVDATRRIAEMVLENKHSLVIMVGGIAEQMISQRGNQTIYVHKRKGHIRLALKHGTPIVPGYNFGETDLYTHSSFLLSFRQMIAKKFAFALLFGYGSSRWVPFLPHKGVVLNQVFGKPISVEKNENPSTEDIDKLHAQYVSELVRVFNKYKEKYGYKDSKLQVC